MNSSIQDVIEYLQGDETIYLRSSEQGRLGIQGERRNIQIALASMFKEYCDDDNFGKIVNAFMNFTEMCVDPCDAGTIWVFDNVEFDKKQEKNRFEGQVE